MACTPAQLEANRLNAAKSTGPTTAEGKEASRRNSLKHGMTGAGVVMPNEDAQAVEERFLAFSARFKPQDGVDAYFIRKAAKATVRLDRIERHQDAVLAGRVRRASTDFDEARLSEVDRLFDWIAAEPQTNARRLRQGPEGVDRLVDAWHALKIDLEQFQGSHWNAGHHQRLANLLGRRPHDFPVTRAGALSDAVLGQPQHLEAGEGAGMGPAELKSYAKDRLIELIDEQVAGLRAHRETLDLDAIAQSRVEASEVALVDDSPSALLTRKYEAAAERTLNRSMEWVVKLQQLAPAGSGEANAAPDLPATPDELGSFLQKLEDAPTERPKPRRKPYPTLPGQKSGSSASILDHLDVKVGPPPVPRAK